MRVCLLTGMCWCNELLIRSARCFTPRSCAPASEGPSHPQVRITVLEPFPACPGRPRYPGMPSAASLSQHALGGLAIPACSGRPRYPSMLWAASLSQHAPGLPSPPPSPLSYLVYIFFPMSLAYSLSPSCTTSQNTFPLLKISSLRQVCIKKEKETSSHPASKINLTNTTHMCRFDLRDTYIYGSKIYFSQLNHIPVLHSPTPVLTSTFPGSIMKTYKLMEGTG